MQTNHRTPQRPRAWRRYVTLAAAVVLACIGSARAQSLEGVLMPGPVIQGHAKYESECRRCHIPFDRAAQNRLCVDCHKDVGADVRDKRGYHGRLAPQPCRACHTDHKGRDAVIVQLDETKFDHRATDFELRGAHAGPKLECRSCHQPKRKFREAPSTCVACHRKDDTHKGRFGERCESCHVDRAWPTITFDHDRDTKYPLRGKHRQIKCESCHTSNAYKEKLASDCIACHQKDDKH